MKNYRVHKNPPLVRVFSQFNFVRTFHELKMKHEVILPKVLNWRYFSFSSATMISACGLFQFRYTF
jgi:hypothetical protein